MMTPKPEFSQCILVPMPLHRKFVRPIANARREVITAGENVANQGFSKEVDVKDGQTPTNLRLASHLGRRK